MLLRLSVALGGAMLCLALFASQAQALPSLQERIVVINASAHTSDAATRPTASQAYTIYLPLLQKPARIYLPLIRYFDSNFVKPGTYVFTDRCYDWGVRDTVKPKNIAGKLRFCVDAVEVQADGFMKFNVSWTLLQIVWPYTYIVKYSDYSNPNMNIWDNVGNRYDHVGTGDAAAQDTYFHHPGDRYTGWFLFPPAKPFAYIFAFHDDDQHFIVPDLVLGGPPPETP